MLTPAVLALASFSGETRAMAQAINIDINVSVRHTVGGVSTFDRSKFITIHDTQTGDDWNGGQRGAENFTSDLLVAFVEDYDVYFGRDTGLISGTLREAIGEDPDRPGWARVSGGEDSIAFHGAKYRHTYHENTRVHRYEARNREVIAAQFHPFWPDGTKTENGWALSQADTPDEPFGSATGEYMGQFLNHFHRGIYPEGRPMPEWVEVINEPDWPLIDNGDTPPAKVWTFHNAVADRIRALNSKVKIGGYCTTFPNLDKGDFKEWREQWKLFIDMCGRNMDFWSLHLYDWPCIHEGEQHWRKGSNLEATFDLIEHYSKLALGEVKPFVISEYGAQMHNHMNEPWSPYRDWLFVKSVTGMLLTFMDRPHLMEIALPFIVPKGEWGRGDVPYNWRLMRQADEPDSASGEWVYTEMVKFYQLWSDVKGIRIDTRASDPDIQTDAFVDGNTAYVVLNNLDEQTQTLQVHLVEDHGNPVVGVREKNLYWNGFEVVLDDTMHHGLADEVSLGNEGTVILAYRFERPVQIDHTSDETKYYADSYLQPIVEGETGVFAFHGVSTGAHGEAVLRLGMGREHHLSKEPVVLFNDTEIAVPTDFMGRETDDKDTFFGVLDIPVPYDLVRPNNKVSVTYPDTGGHISSVTLRCFTFSKEMRL